MTPSARRQLPPQITKVTLSDGKSVRYELRTAVSDTAGKRRWVKRRFEKESEARSALATINGAAAAGVFVGKNVRTIDAACTEWLRGKRGVRPTTLYGYTHALAPIQSELGTMPIQKVTKADLDAVVDQLVEGGLIKGKGKARKPWSARSVNMALRVFGQVLESEQQQGTVVRNVAALVDRLPVETKDMETYTPDEVSRLLTAVEPDRLEHAWHLALSGLRRGEVAGLEWADVDLVGGKLTVRHNRVTTGAVTHDSSPKSRRSSRTLPLTAGLAEALRTAKRRQAAERLALGGAYGSGMHVVVDEAGNSVAPANITFWWVAACKKAGVRRIRLHDARHTCGTLMHLQGVPLAVISAWLGHASVDVTARVYLHSQNDALTAAAESYGAVVSKRVIGTA